MSRSAPTVVAFAGLGVMGLPMARNAAAAGFDVRAYDVDPAAAERAAAAGLRTVGALPEALRAADVVVTMLPDTPQVEEVVRGGEGVLAHCRPGTVLVDMSTVSPGATADLAAELAARGLAMVDAPVSGGVRGARAGELSIMAGGEAADVERVRAVLSALGRVTHVGAAGAGQVVKACNQVAVALTIQAACEAFTLGARFGVDPEALRAALLGGAASSWVLEHLGPQMTGGDDSAGFRIALQVKDLRIATEAASASGTPLPGAAGVLQLYLAAVAGGQAGDGNQALTRVYERLAGVTIARRDPGAPEG
ncbi:NAD(P)-dependent oxidoreductase [Streptomyces sp. SBT349]|uniref:NAD(P)-dependent oxidoreductase n=1 Tax=Streptomyces sp. SBT349 TaxID=1580539 RepID=UPI00066AC017|nr:NAD(P)-dependent oxidoreductase [Streptomyces sp. SBT349]